MYSWSTGEVNSNRVTSSLLRKRTRLPTHAHEVRAFTFDVTDNFGSNVVLPCGAYGPWSETVGLRLTVLFFYRLLLVKALTIGTVMCLFDRNQTGITQKVGKEGQTHQEDGEGREGMGRLFDRNQV